MAGVLFTHAAGTNIPATIYSNLLKSPSKAASHLYARVQQMRKSGVKVVGAVEAGGMLSWSSSLMSVD